MKTGYLACLLLFPLLLGRSANFVAPAPLRADALLAEVVIGSPQTAAGAEQTLHVRLTAVAGPEISFRLNLTYPSGVTQEVTGITTSRAATLTWVIPPAAGVGTAQYTLYAIDCGCGDQTGSRPTSNRVDKISEEFEVE